MGAGTPSTPTSNIGEMLLLHLIFVFYSIGCLRTVRGRPVALMYFVFVQGALGNREWAKPTLSAVFLVLIFSVFFSCSKVSCVVHLGVINY